MYLPAAFAVPELDELHRIVREHPLGMLVTQGADGLDANHLPFELDTGAGPHGVLLAHVARANDVWQRVGDGAQVLVVFRGAQGYVSPNWYPSKALTHRHVPTWNYEAVHVHGRLRVRDDGTSVRRIVARLTRRHEAREPRPWKMGDAPAEYLDALLKMIVGIEVEIERIEGKRKLSQNREPGDFAGVVRALRDSGQEELARAMERVAPRG